MSVHFLFARFVDATQCSLSGSDFTPRAQCFEYFELFSVGWQSGARTRSKKFGTSERAFAYINKLHAGEWLSDVEYDRVWLLLTEVCHHTAGNPPGDYRL
jgi:hypothetical protein